MKHLFILLNIVLFFIIVVLGVVFFTHKVQPPEKVLKNTPSIANKSYSGLFKIKKDLITSSAISLVVDNNLFSPSRGVVDKVVAKKVLPKLRKTNFELIGLVTMGDLKGAIIINKSKRSDKKNLYLVEDMIDGTAYKLININPNEESAIIGMGNSHFEIKLERGDQGSLSRRKAGEARSKALVSLSQPKTLVKKILKSNTKKKSVTKKPKRVLSQREIRSAKRRALLKKMEQSKR